MTEAVSETILTTIEAWRSRLLALSEVDARRKPAPDRWSIAEVVGHLVDSACNNHQRFVRAQDCDSLKFPKYDQNAWVAVGNYNQADWPSLVDFWCLYNRQLAHLIRNIPHSQLDTPCTIEPYPTCTLQFLVEDYLVHMQHHLQILSERMADDP